MDTKKHPWVISLILTLCSCSQSDTIIDSKSESELEQETEQIVVEDKDPLKAYYREHVITINDEYNALGYGYDVTGEYLSPLSVRKQVIDIASYKEAEPQRVIEGNTSYSYADYYYGNTYSDYLEDIIRSSKVTDSFRHENKTDTQNTYLYFAGNFVNHQYLQSKYSHSNQYSFASMEFLQHRKRVYINDEISSMQRFLSKDFSEDLYKYPADKIIEMYGTHVLMNFNLGGRYKVIYRSVIEEKKYFTNKAQILKSEFNTILSKIGFIVPSSDTQTDEEFDRNRQNKDLYVQLYLKDGIMSFKYDLEDDMPTRKDVLIWEGETLDAASQLTFINWTENYPLYEFISDPVKREEIKFAVEYYISMSKNKL